MTIGSQYENQLISTIARSISNDLWIGASDRTTEGTWRWLSGNTDGATFFTEGVGTANGYFAGWLGGTPSNVEDGARIRQDLGQWEVTNTNSTYGYVIEWDASEVLSNFRYTITSDPSGAFTINANTGEVTVSNAAPLSEVASNPTITVQVTDAAAIRIQKS